MSQPITHAQFAERLCYRSASIASWAGSCLTLPEDNGKPMKASSVYRFIEETQRWLDFLREDLAALQEAEERAQKLADANQKKTPPDV